MASDGLTNRAKNGKCRMCYRVRNVDKYLKAVGEVRHGMAMGHIWECVDVKDCNGAIDKKLADHSRHDRQMILIEKEIGRYEEYIIKT